MEVGMPIAQPACRAPWRMGLAVAWAFMGGAIFSIALIQNGLIDAKSTTLNLAANINLDAAGGGMMASAAGLLPFLLWIGMGYYVFTWNKGLKEAGKEPKCGIKSFLMCCCCTPIACCFPIDD